MPSLSQVAGAVRQIPRAVTLIRRYGRPPAILYFGHSPGDDLLATAVLRQWRRVRGTRAAYLTRHPELFEHNEDVAFTAPFDPLLAGAFRVLGVPRRRLTYHPYDAATDRSLAPRNAHIINLMCAAAGLPPIPSPKPLLALTTSEMPAARLRRIVVHSSVMSAAIPIRNKEWPPERMQAVVDALKNDAEIVQLGRTGDPRLAGALDMRGKGTLRQAAALIAGSRLFIGMVGFLMHLAAAVDTPSVVVFGGREHPDQSGYPQNRNLFTELPCSPCWLWNTCPYERECLRRIEARDVVAHARALLT